MSLFHCDVFTTPRAASPTACRDALIKAEGRTNHWQVNAAVGVLLEEGNPHAARKEEKHAVRIAGADLGDLGRIIGLSQLGINLAGQFTLEETFVSGQGVGGPPDSSGPL